MKFLWVGIDLFPIEMLFPMFSSRTLRSVSLFLFHFDTGEQVWVGGPSETARYGYGCDGKNRYHKIDTMENIYVSETSILIIIAFSLYKGSEAFDSSDAI